MKVEISAVRNGLLVKIEIGPTANDPLAQRLEHAGTWFAQDAVDAIGRIAEAVRDSYPPT